MAFPLRSILVYLLFFYTYAVLFVNTQPLSLPGCQSTCGNFSIPYPFGIGRGCYRNKGFELICRSEDSGLMLKNIGAKGANVSRLSLQQISVQGPLISKCYKESGDGHVSNDVPGLDLTHSPFTFSHTHNQFAAAGCDIFSYISVPNHSKYKTGCASLCVHKDTNIDFLNTNTSCSGIGCCQTSIPKGLKKFDLSVYSINTRTRSWKSNPSVCSVAGVNDWASFPKLLKSFMGNVTKSSGLYSIATLDWAIGSASCKHTARNASACVASNSECIDSSNGPGYRCNCSTGYQGNPYLHDGCQDINECEGENQCEKGSMCINTKGSYNCRCPTGYYGDGRKGGAACSSTDGRFSKTEVILTAIGVAVGIIVMIALCFWLHKKIREERTKKLKEKFFKKNGGLLLEQQLSSDEENVEKTKIFVTEELEKATDNFNESRVLGTGGFGTVYKGMLTDGRIVAIKKSKIVDESQTGQFINELVILSQINHKHVVKLLGCCLEAEVPLLVYEYISNGTLSHHLHDKTRESSLSWEQRLQISREIAGAFSYLHSSASTPIFHRDIKTPNILLNETYKAVVADFGMSRSVPSEKTHLTTQVQGTLGYLDPEFYYSGQYTDKSDVYSFGVVLVELLTGQKPVSVFRSEEERNLAMHFLSSVKAGRLFDILYTRELDEYGKKEVVVVANIAKRCLKRVGKKRPTMKEVMVELEGLQRFEDQPLSGQEYRYTENSGRWSDSSHDSSYDSGRWSDSSHDSSYDSSKIEVVSRDNSF